MNAGLAAILVLITYLLGYRYYSNFIAKKVFALSNENKTPAHLLNDGIDYVPTKKAILFGHHYASIAGLSPMLGPAVAVIWGWAPALIWIVLGSLFIGCVHDFGALVLSIRHQGESIGAVAEKVIGKRAKGLMHGIIFFLVSLGMGVFVYVIAFLFSPSPEPSVVNVHYPQAIVPSLGLMLVAVSMAIIHKKFKISMTSLALVGFILTLLLIALSMNDEFIGALGIADVTRAPSMTSISISLLGYAFLASVVPVWFLLQPRDFLNSLLLYLGLFLILVSIIYLQPKFNAPALRLNPEGAPPLFPFMFIVIACGSISGFHSLVASGTTAKQINKESDARLIGYGGMIGESMLGVIAVFATTAGVSVVGGDWSARYSSWESVQGLGPQVGGFIAGCASFLNGLGISQSIGEAFLSVVVVSFALTSLDSATRLLRYNIEEIMDSLSFSALNNRFVAAALAVSSIGFFAFYRVDGKPAGLALWSLFGTTNQILAGLSLGIVSFYLWQKKRMFWPLAIPMAFVLTLTLGAMVINLYQFYHNAHAGLFVIAAILLFMVLWLILEAAFLIIKKHKATNVGAAQRI